MHLIVDDISTSRDARLNKLLDEVETTTSWAAIISKLKRLPLLIHSELSEVDIARIKEVFDSKQSTAPSRHSDMFYMLREQLNTGLAATEGPKPRDDPAEMGADESDVLPDDPGDVYFDSPVIEEADQTPVHDDFPALLCDLKSYSLKSVSTIPKIDVHSAVSVFRIPAYNSHLDTHVGFQDTFKNAVAHNPLVDTTDILHVCGCKCNINYLINVLKTRRHSFPRCFTSRIIYILDGGVKLLRKRPAALATQLDKVFSLAVCANELDHMIRVFDSAMTNPLLFPPRSTSNGLHVPAAPPLSPSENLVQNTCAPNPPLVHNKSSMQHETILQLLEQRDALLESPPQSQIVSEPLQWSLGYVSFNQLMGSNAWVTYKRLAYHPSTTKTYNYACAICGMIVNASRCKVLHATYHAVRNSARFISALQLPSAEVIRYDFLCGGDGTSRLRNLDGTLRSELQPLCVWFNKTFSCRAQNEAVSYSANLETALDLMQCVGQPIPILLPIKTSVFAPVDENCRSEPRCYLCKSRLVYIFRRVWGFDGAYNLSKKDRVITLTAVTNCKDSDTPISQHIADVKAYSDKISAEVARLKLPYELLPTLQLMNSALEDQIKNFRENPRFQLLAMALTSYQQLIINLKAVTQESKSGYDPLADPTPYVESISVPASKYPKLDEQIPDNSLLYAHSQCILAASI